MFYYVLPLVQRIITDVMLHYRTVKMQYYVSSIALSYSTTLCKSCLVVFLNTVYSKIIRKSLLDFSVL